MPPVLSKVDHEDRLDLKRMVEKPRDVKPLADIKMKVTLGPGQVKKTSVMEMYEEYKTEEGGQLLFNDGTLVIPVVDYLKAKLKIKSVETVERMERELNLMHQDLIGKGSTKEEVKNVIKASEKYAKYQKLMSEIAEVIVKEALEQLGIPGLIIRSVVKLDVWRRCSQLYLKAGISVSGVDRKEKDFKNEVERVRIEEERVKGRIYHNLPVELAALGDKLVQAEQGKRRIIIMIDEVFCHQAPEDKEQTFYNWTSLEKIPDQLTIILMFNPGTYSGRRLLLPPSCLRLVLETTYRSTKSISNLHSCLVTAIKRNAPPGNPGTEVVGELPRLVPLGDLGEEEEAAEKLRQGLQMIRGFMGTEDVTVIIDENKFLSDNILSSAPPPSAFAAAESDHNPDPQQFSSWKGKAAAKTLLPDV